jgi:AAA+ ATPase superfamily predicted ATPase
MIDRERELAFLTARAASKRAELIVMWGRRRLGKTTLLKALCESHDSIYFLATKASAHEQLVRLSAAFAEHFDDPLLRQAAFPSWESAFEYLAAQAKSRVVLVVDEFPYLVEADPSLPSRFQFGWDEHLSRNRHVMMVLNGSSLAMMEEHVLGAKSPLYGRRTGQWRLEPFGLLEARAFYPKRTLVEAVETYAVVGGVPFYILQFDPDDTLAHNIQHHILSKGAVLYEEVPFLLREEVREPRSYFPILGAIAGGSRKFGEISSKTGLDKANLSKYMGALQELHLLRRDVPVTETVPAKSRKGLYAIEDPFTDFWMRYVWPNLASLELERARDVWKRHIEPDFPRYVSQRCERFAGDLLRHGPVRKWLSFDPATVGRYWDAGVELDLVAVSADRSRAVIAEVKWTSGPTGAGVIDGLRRRVESVAALREMRKQYLLISRSGFSEKARAQAQKDVFLLDLRAL